MIIRKILVTTCLILTFSLSYSQESYSQIDSIRGLLRHVKGSDKIDVLFDLSYNHVLINNNDTALRYAMEGYQLSIKAEDSLRVVKTGLVTASALRRLQKIDSSIVIYHAILPTAEKNGNSEELALLFNSLGIAYTFKAQYDRALSCYFRSLRLRESGTDRRSQVPVLQNIAVLYYKLKDYEKALQIFLQCHALANKTGMHEEDDLLLMNIGHCYAYLNDFPKAVNYIDQAVRHCGDACSEQRILEFNFVKGLISYGRKDFKSAEQFFLNSHALSKSVGNIRFQLDNIDYLSQIYMEQKRIAVAARYLDEAEKLIGQNGSFNLERIKIYSRLSQLFLTTRNFEAASAYQLKYGRLKDSVYNEEMTRNLMKAEAEFLERENTARISAQDEVIALKEQVIERQQTLNKITALLFILFAGFVIVLLRGYWQKRGINAVLEKKIRERTQELEFTADQSLKAFHEKNLILIRTSQAICETARNIKGLCSLGTREVSDPLAHAYFERILTVSGDLSQLVQPQDRERLLAEFNSLNY